MRKNILKGSSLVLLGAITLVACKKETDFTVVNPEAWVGEPVVIKDNNEKYKRNTTVFYDFGDNQSTNIGDNSRISQINPSHVYEAPGVYTITQQVMRSKNVQKRSGKTYTGSTTVTIKTVTPVLEVLNTTPNAGQTIVITNKTDETGRKGYDVDYWVIISGPTAQSYINSNDDKTFYWTPGAAGKYSIVLYAQQGGSQAKVMSAATDVTVGGVTSSEINGFFKGKWNISATASLSGNAYSSTACGAAGTYVSKYSSISIDANNNVYSAIVGNPSTQSGNVEEPFTNFDVRDGGYVYVGGEDFIVNTSTTGFNREGNANGVYVIKTATQSAITLERIHKGTNDCTGAVEDETWSDTYTITLTR